MCWAGCPLLWEDTVSSVLGWLPPAVGGHSGQCVGLAAPCCGRTQSVVCWAGCPLLWEDTVGSVLGWLML